MASLASFGVEVAHQSSGTQRRAVEMSVKISMNRRSASACVTVAWFRSGGDAIQLGIIVDTVGAAKSGFRYFLGRKLATFSLVTSWNGMNTCFSTGCLLTRRMAVSTAVLP
jgi:hypothetical protein